MGKGRYLGTEFMFVTDVGKTSVLNESHENT